MSFIKNFLFTITHPRYWMMLYRYSKPLDTWLNEQLKNGIEFTDLDKYHVTINKRRFWIANKPYGFNERTLEARPSRLTIKKFYDRLEETYLKCEQS